MEVTDRDETLSYVEDMLANLRDMALEVDAHVLAHVIHVAVTEARIERKRTSKGDSQHSAA